MLNTEIINIANGRIKLKIDDRLRRLCEDLERVKAEMADRGILHSGPALQEIATVCIAELKNISQLLWQTLSGFITTSGASYSEDLAVQMTCFFDM